MKIKVQYVKGKNSTVFPTTLNAGVNGWDFDSSSLRLHPEVVEIGDALIEVLKALPEYKNIHHMKEVEIEI